MVQSLIEYFISSPDNEVTQVFTKYIKEVFCNVKVTERHKLKENNLWEEIYTILSSPDTDSYKLTLEMLRSSDLFEHEDLMNLIINDNNLNHVMNAILTNEYNF